MIRVCAVLLLVVSVACGGSDAPSATDAPSVRERAVTFENDAGQTLTGRVFGRGRVGVVLSHMYPADATSWYPAARRIAQAGYMALAFNFRGFADSDGSQSVTRTPDDIAAANRYLRSAGARQLVYVGASMGGTASIMAATNQNPIAVVTISAPLRFRGLDAIFVANRVQRPVLLLAARGDGEAFDALEQLNQALPTPVTKVYDGDAHGTNLLADRPEAVDEVIAFLERYAPTRSATETGEP